jgi:hypothetical protein
MMVDVLHQVTCDKSFPISGGRVGVEARLSVAADSLGHDHQECPYNARGDQAIECPCPERTLEPAGVRIRHWLARQRSREAMKHVQDRMARPCSSATRTW